MICKSLAIDSKQNDQWSMYKVARDDGVFKGNLSWKDTLQIYKSLWSLTAGYVKSENPTFKKQDSGSLSLFFSLFDTIQDETWAYSFKPQSICYEDVFFRKSSYVPSLIPFAKFPSIITCSTFETLLYHLPTLGNDMNGLHIYDDSCQVSVKQMFDPCSNKKIISIKIFFSLMVIWMGCSFILIKFSKIVAKVIKPIVRYIKRKLYDIYNSLCSFLIIIETLLSFR